MNIRLLAPDSCTEARREKTRRQNTSPVLPVVILLMQEKIENLFIKDRNLVLIVIFCKSVYLLIENLYLFQLSYLISTLIFSKSTLIRLYMWDCVHHFRCILRQSSHSLWSRDKQAGFSPASLRAMLSGNMTGYETINQYIRKCVYFK